MSNSERSTSASAKQVERLGQSIVEFVFLFAIIAAPWPLGSTGATAKFYLCCVVCVAFLTFSVRLLHGAFPKWQAGLSGLLIVFGFTGLGLVALVHLLDLPQAWVSAFAPGVEHWVVMDSISEPASLVSTSKIDSGMEWFSGSKLGLNARGSFQFLLDIATLGIVFGIGCYCRRPTESLQRLGVTAAILGTAVAIFGIARHVGSHEWFSYWNDAITRGSGFGPFVNRNHFPFFMNMVLGLTIGLLLERFDRSRRVWFRVLLTDQYVSWLVVALMFMITSLILCVSRGGVLFGLIAIIVVLLLRWNVSGMKAPLRIGIGVLCASVLLLTWLGFDIFESRLNQLAESDRYSSDGRWHLWKAALMSFSEFPWFGSGGETYRYWETIYMTGDPAWQSETMRSTRADNEYLDILNEYGIVGLVGLLLIAIPVCYRSLLAAKGSGLSAGAAIGVLAVLLHSLGDFGLRIPANGLFAAYLAGLLCSQSLVSKLGSPQSHSRPASQMAKNASATRRLDTASGMLVRVPIAIALAAFSFFLLIQQRRNSVAEQQFDRAVAKLQESDYETALSHMISSVEATPENIQGHLSIAKFIQRIIDQPDANISQSWLLDRIIFHSQFAEMLCPLAWEPRVWRAQFGTHYASEQDRLADLRRARRLHPGDSQLSYLTGRYELQQNGLESAIPHWRESLTYSTRYLVEIMDSVRLTLTPDEVVDTLLPADPVVTHQAAQWDQAQPELRELCISRTLQLLDSPGLTKRKLDVSAQHALRASCYEMTGQLARSASELQLALNETPEDISVRVRFAQLLIQLERQSEAESQVRILLQLDPGNRAAKQMQETLVKKSVGPSS